MFPTPVVLESRPTLVGYYRLLIGVSQKSFYGTGTGMGPFKSMEEKGIISTRAKDLLPEFCSVMGEALADLVRQLSPAVTPRDVAELPLLTLGSKFQGSNNNTIGQTATLDVFLSILAIVEDFVVGQQDKVLTLNNSSGRAEKSHIKAKREGFRDFWTIIAKKGLDLEKLKSESPTTNSWFDTSRVLGRQGEERDEFKSRLSGEVGIPISSAVARKDD